MSLLFAHFYRSYFNRRAETNGKNLYFSRMDVVCKRSLYCNCRCYFSENCYKHSKLHIKGEVEWGV